MNRIIGVGGFVLVLLLVLHSFAPVVGLDDGILADWVFVALVVALLPLGAVMAVRRHRAKRAERAGR